MGTKASDERLQHPPSVWFSFMLRFDWIARAKPFASALKSLARSVAFNPGIQRAHLNPIRPGKQALYLSFWLISLHLRRNIAIMAIIMDNSFAYQASL
jgi:hypothetical protein